MFTRLKSITLYPNTIASSTEKIFIIQGLIVKRDICFFNIRAVFDVFVIDCSLSLNTTADIWRHSPELTSIRQPHSLSHSGLSDVTSTGRSVILSVNLSAS